MIYRKLIDEIRDHLKFFLSYFPGRIGFRLRYCYYKKAFRSCGARVFIPGGCIIRGEANISIGNDVSFGLSNYIYSGNEMGREIIQIGNNVNFNSNVMVNADLGGQIRIGNNVLIGPNVVLRPSNHIFSRRDIPIREQGHTGGSINIGDDVWIGSNAVILRNVNIGTGAIVGAGSIVTKDVGEFTIVAGVPARKIGER